MIGYLRGQVIEHQDGRLVVAVGGGGGAVGYVVNVPASASYMDLLPGKEVELQVHTHVREDALDLFAFRSASEKALFLTLLSVNGIGPRVAMGILANIEVPVLIEAVLSGDKDVLVKIPGIGKKTAERVVLELGDTLRKKVEAGVFGDSSRKKTGKETRKETSKAGSGELFTEAKEALMGLGYREPEVAAVLNRVIGENAEVTKVEELVRSALRFFAR